MCQRQRLGSCDKTILSPRLLLTSELYGCNTKDVKDKKVMSHRQRNSYLRCYRWFSPLRSEKRSCCAFSYVTDDTDIQGWNEARHKGCLVLTNITCFPTFSSSTCLMQNRGNPIDRCCTRGRHSSWDVKLWLMFIFRSGYGVMWNSMILFMFFGIHGFS